MQIELVFKITQEFLKITPDKTFLYVGQCSQASFKYLTSLRVAKSWSYTSCALPFHWPMEGT